MILSVLILLALALVAGALVLGLVDIEPPSVAVEKVIPNDRLQR